MISQYTNGYSNPSSDIQNIVANKVSLLDSYILMQTDANEYTALIYDPATKKTEEYIFTRDSSTYNSYYSVSSKVVEDFEYYVNNEYYVYSNVGYGKSLDLPVNNGVIAHSLAVIVCLCMLGVMFKGVLFKCLNSRKK